MVLQDAGEAARGFPGGHQRQEKIKIRIFLLTDISVQRYLDISYRYITDISAYRYLSSSVDELRAVHPVISIG